jgi:hypothetical protein
MRTFTIARGYDPVFAGEQAALAAAIAAWAPPLPLFDLEAMILSGDDGRSPYWFAPPYAARADALFDGASQLRDLMAFLVGQDPPPGAEPGPLDGLDGLDGLDTHGIAITGASGAIWNEGLGLSAGLGLDLGLPP